MPITAHFAWLVLSMLLASCTRAPATGERAASESKPEPAVDPTPASEPRPASAPDATPPADADKTPSGLASQVLKPGSGDKRPKPYDKVRVDFSAWNSKGKLVDGSQQRGGPETYAVTGVIAGWAEALQLMRVGERRRLWIPDELVYPGRPGFPRAMAVFELELLEILDGTPPRPAPDDVAAAPSDALETRSGLSYKLLTNGEGHEKPKPWDRVTIHYTGWTADGAMFDSTHTRARPSVFGVDQELPGWREALPLLSVGDTARFWIPEALAYQGRAGKPKGPLVFDIELLSIERRPEPPRAPAQLAAPPANAKRTKSGLAYRMLTKGEGKTKPSANDRVEVHYSAWTSDGALFDSSVTRGKSATVPVSRVIPGWGEGLQQMVEGDKALFWIPEELAYGGKAGSPRGLLVYEVELLKIVP